MSAELCTDWFHLVRLAWRDASPGLRSILAGYDAHERAQWLRGRFSSEISAARWGAMVWWQLSQSSLSHRRAADDIEKEAMRQLTDALSRCAAAESNDSRCPACGYPTGNSAWCRGCDADRSQVATPAAPPPAVPMERPCPLCKGKKTALAVDAIEADGRLVSPRSVPCMVCDGSGVCPEEAEDDGATPPPAADPAPLRERLEGLAAEWEAAADSSRVRTESGAWNSVEGVALARCARRLRTLLAPGKEESDGT